MSLKDHLPGHKHKEEPDDKVSTHKPEGEKKPDAKATKAEIEKHGTLTVEQKGENNFYLELNGEPPEQGIPALVRAHYDGVTEEEALESFAIEVRKIFPDE